VPRECPNQSKGASGVPSPAVHFLNLVAGVANGAENDRIVSEA